MTNVAVLGGGMAGLATAWQLTGEDCRDDFRVTVYQRGWRLGGKGASSRGANGRIEEHGLHVWLGYYDNAFRLIREVYEDLDRPHTDPSCPITTWPEAFSPSNRVGVEDQLGDSWSHWMANFTQNAGVPGAVSSETGSLSPARFVQRGLRLLIDFSASLTDRGAQPSTAEFVLSGSPHPPRRPAPPTYFDRLLRQAVILGVVGATEALRMAERATGDQSSRSLVLDWLRQLNDQLSARIRPSSQLRRSGDLANLVISCLQGTIRDNLSNDPSGFAAVDHLDFRQWLRRHGAHEQTLLSPLVRGMYDLVFAYEEGDRNRPRFSAGLGLLLASRLFFDYQGSIFWHMQGGMGDVVFAPLYQALRNRGVRFEFFHRVDRLHLSPDHSGIAAISLGRQATFSPRAPSYEPLVTVKGLPCFPSAPRTEDLVTGVDADLESHWSDRTTEKSVRLERGVDFDVAILATSIGMVPHIAQEILAHSARWRAMVANVATVPTQSLQLWLRSSEAGLGWPHQGSTVSGYSPPFDTYASMSHLIAREDWPGEDRIRGVAYFCGVLAKSAELDPAGANALVRRNAVEFLTHHAGHFWPAGRGPDGHFRWELLRSASSDPETALDSQYLRANVDPSDQYVQSLPASGASRLRADESGYSNLFLAGDWINCGLNAGCIEAAVMAGVQAANAVRGRQLTENLLGQWYGLD